MTNGGEFTDRSLHAFSVSQLNEYIKMIMDSSPVLNNIFVRGEISNFTNHYKTGHLYFSLKDDSGLIRAVMFRTYTENLKFIPENGMKVTVHGKVSAYPRDGQYQIYVDGIEPDGIGALYLAYEQLKNKLEAEGLFDISRKRELPRFPRRIGVITSPTGAAVRDIINITGRRCPGADIVLFPALVQGRDAPASLIGGMKYFNTLGNVDVIIIGRGGGSIEDLWAFNDENLARTVAASKIPVISAVGHETDFTICDFAADLRAPTPSAAAELAVPDTSALISGLNIFRDRMNNALGNKLDSFKKTLTLYKSSGVMAAPTAVFELRKMDLCRSEEKLNGEIRRILDSNRADFRLFCGKLAGLNPLTVLERGYGEVEDKDGNVVSSVADIEIGDTLTVRLRDGYVKTTVDQINQNSATQSFRGKDDL